MAGTVLALSPRSRWRCSQAGEPQSTAWPWGQRAEVPGAKSPGPWVPFPRMLLPWPGPSAGPGPGLGNAGTGRCWEGLGRAGDAEVSAAVPGRSHSARKEPLLAVTVPAQPRGFNSPHRGCSCDGVCTFRFVFQHCCQGHSPLQCLCEQLCARCPFCCDSHKHSFNKTLPPPPALLRAGITFA